MQETTGSTKLSTCSALLEMQRTPSNYCVLTLMTKISGRSAIRAIKQLGG